MRLLVCQIIVACFAVDTVTPGPPRPVRYDFRDQMSPVYEYIVRTELPDAVDIQTGHLFYAIKSVDPANGQITFGFSREFHTDRQRKLANGEVDPSGVSHFPSRGGALPDPNTSPEMVIDPTGKPLRSVLGEANQNLPDLMGLAWQLPFQPLPPDGQTTWKTERDVTLYERVARPGQPGPFFRPQPDDFIARPSHEVVTYNVDKTNDDTETVKRHVEMATDEKSGDVPVETVNGDGRYVFDRHAGLMQSLEFKQTVEANQNNITVRVPCTISMRLLSVDEVAKLRADQAAAEAEAKTRLEKLRSQFAQQHANDASEIPEGSIKTEMVGGHGGGPYIKLNKDKQNVIGFTIRIGSWAGHPVLGRVDPLYEAPADMNPDGATVCLARPGYVVGGIIVGDQDGAAGMSVLFMRRTTNGLNTSDSYASPWYGYDEGTKHTLAGHGERVIGTFGRQGMNMDAIGLVVEPAVAAPKDPAVHL